MNNLKVCLLVKGNPPIEWIEQTQKELKEFYEVEKVLIIKDADRNDIIITEKKREE